MSLAPNQQQLFLREWNHQLEIGSFQVSSIDISDIKYLVTGNACLHVKEHRLNLFSGFLEIKIFSWPNNCRRRVFISIEGRKTRLFFRCFF